MRETAEELVAPYVLPDEAVLWTGRPKQGLLLRRVGALTVAVGLVVAGFFIFMAYGLLASDGLLERLGGMSLVLIALYGVFEHFDSDARRRARTAYALTSRRVMIITKSRRTNVTSLALARLVQVELSEHRDGSGTISLGPPLAWRAEGFGSLAHGEQPPEFEGIADARRVYGQIRLAQGHAQETPR